MFACGQYPASDPQFLKSIEREAECQLSRLKWHTSIVVYAGNNEDYQLAEAEGLDWVPGDQDSRNWLGGTFPARYVYEKVLPEVVARVVPGVEYHPGSPWGGNGANDTKVGDIHQWNGI
jgi:beta-mannosidase